MEGVRVVDPAGLRAGGRRVGRRRWSVAVVLVTTLLLAACGGEGVQRQAVGPDDGLQVSGPFAGQRVSVSDGEPEVRLDDCDPADGPDQDLCIIARTIDGQDFELRIQNPDRLEAGTRVAVARSRCRARACDDATDLVVDVRLGDETVRASGESLRVRRAGPRFAAEFQLRFGGGGALSGSFDVRP